MGRSEVFSPIRQCNQIPLNQSELSESTRPESSPGALPRKNVVLPVTSVIILLLGGALVAGGIGAIWLFGIGPATGLAAPISPGLVLTAFITAGLIAGSMVYLQLRHLFFRSDDHTDIISHANRDAAVGVWVLDDQQRTVWSNESMGRILGEVPSEGEHPFSFLDEKSSILIGKQIEARKRGESSTYWISLKNCHGEEKRAIVCASPIMSSDDRFEGSIAVFMDMTEVLDQREREKCVDPQESNLKTISAIVDHLDHKLNNSLMIIRGQAEIFFRRDQDGPDSQGLKNIMDQVDLINEELEALSDLKKIETEAYLGEHFILKVPRKKTESKNTT